MIKKTIIFSLTAVLFSASGVAFANADMLKKFNCMACHAADKKMFGPSWKEVSAKYAGQSGVTETLAKKIQVGGAGSWGQLPMPAQPQVSDADALTLSAYILTVK